MRIEQRQPTCTHVYIDGISGGKEFWCLFRSDVHHDSKHCDRQLEKKHLDEALERKALIFDLGDAYDAMQGSGDKRGSKSSIDPEYNADNYGDKLVDKYVDFLSPYAKNIALMGLGNHETAFRKYKDTNLTERTIKRLNDKGGNIMYGHYAGYIVFHVSRTFNKSQYERFVVYYHHGYGGSSPVTKGVIQHNRRSANFLADCYISGHLHTKWMVFNERIQVNGSGYVESKPEIHIQLPTYKRNFDGAQGMDGWETEKGFPSSPLGACWLKFTITGHKHILNVEPIWAI